MIRQSMLHRLNHAFVSNYNVLSVCLDGGGLRFRVMANGSRTGSCGSPFAALIGTSRAGLLAALSLASR